MIKLLILNITELKNNEKYQEWLSRMPKERKQKVSACKLPEDQLRSLSAGVLIYKMCEDYGIDGNKIAFAYGEHKKPYIKEHPEIIYNLSHSGNYAVCAYGDAASLGVDIEKKAENHHFGKVAQRFFHEKELQEIDSAEDFCKVWTLKESFLKACGTGLSFPLNEFAIYHKNHKICLEQGLNDACYEFFEDQFEEYCIAVCIEKKNEKSLNVKKEWVAL